MYYDPNLRAYLANSREPINAQKKQIGTAVLDESLSGRRAQVYVEPNGNVKIVHRGSQGFKDWAFNDPALGLNKLGSTKRGQHAAEVQRKAMEKYPKGEIYTYGSSLGGALAQYVGGDNGHVTTFNKGVSPFDAFKKVTNPNQLDIRVHGDPVSAIGKHQTNPNAIELKAPFLLNPHSINGLRYYSEANHLR